VSAAPSEVSALDAACREWIALLGADRVTRDADALAHAGRTTLPMAHQPVTILRPASREDVAAIVRIAARHRCPLHPVSAGKNWGWGDACPAGEGQVLLDLSGLKRIVAIDTELGCAVIEPGVTQGELARRLEGSGWRLDCTGAGPHASVVGNALERGLTFGSWGERFAAVCGLEVVLADGSSVRTGAAAHTSSRTAYSQRYGVGPALDGLFSQSSFGITTEMTLWLTPIAEREEIFWLCADDGAMPELVDRLRPLRIRGVLPTNVHLFLLPNPGGPPKWGGNGAICGSHAAVDAHLHELEAAVSGVARTTTSSRAPVGPALRAWLGVPDFPMVDVLMAQTEALVRGEALEMPSDALVMLVGGPEVQRPLGAPKTSDLRDAGFGLIFSWQVCAAIGSEVRRLVDLVQMQLSAHGCPPLMALQYCSGRSVTLVTRIGYDRKDPARRAAATACQRAILDEAMAAGFPPSRTGLTGQDRLAAASPAFWALAGRLTQALDPSGILAPGRHTTMR
jgi:4-cresol dehydrogenase (hydroxylating) flavoprotein subunit